MQGLSLALSFAVLLAIVPAAALATCYHACADIDIDVGDYIVVRAGSNTPCNWACSGTGYDYGIWKRYDCVDVASGYDSGAFGADEYIPDGVYYVDSIGAGCNGTPNGCIRICDCTS